MTTATCQHPETHCYVLGERVLERVALGLEHITWCRACGAIKGWKPSDDNAPAKTEWQPPDGFPTVPNPFASWFRWTVAIEVEERWVADGFDLTDRRVHDMITTFCPFMTMSECAGSVLTRPPDEEIAKTQGYKSVEEWRNSNAGRR